MSGARRGLAAAREALGTALWLVLAALAWLVRSLETLPERLIAGAGDLMAELGSVLSWRGRLLGLVLLVGLFSLPGWAGSGLVSVLIGALWLAYVGQTWNMLTGFAGPVSLGHCLFVGLGAGLGVGLGVGAGFGLWLGLAAAVGITGAVAAMMAGLAARCGVGGVAFALLTVVFAEAGRVGLGGVGLVYPAAAPAPAPGLAYYVILAMTLGLLVLSRHLLRSATGLRWRAVRADAEAAAAIGLDAGRVRLAAVALSAALTAPAGMFQAWAAHQLVPDQLFSLTRSLEIALAALLGGLGTVFGPVFGALLVGPAGDLVERLLSRGGQPLPGGRGLFIGLALVAVVTLVPGGVWPGMARRFGLLATPDADADERGRR
jgi:branched-chain amino acid transport system permease protein